MKTQRLRVFVATVFVTALAAVSSHRAPSLSPDLTRSPDLTPRPGSYSILAHDPLTGEFGVAAASNAPLVGVNLEFFDPEAGGVVVHGGPHLELNRRALTALREGLPAGTAIQVGLAGLPDEDAREGRQVLAVGPTTAAAFTGERLEKVAAREIGETFVAGGYRLEDGDVVTAMAETFEETQGPLAERLLTALAAGRDAGGEKGGARSAGLLVVGPGARFATRGRLVDLRIDFVPDDAVAALERLKIRIDSIYGVDR